MLSARALRPLVGVDCRRATLPGVSRAAPDRDPRPRNCSRATAPLPASPLGLGGLAPPARIRRVRASNSLDPLLRIRQNDVLQSFVKIKPRTGPGPPNTTSICRGRPSPRLRDRHGPPCPVRLRSLVSVSHLVIPPSRFFGRSRFLRSAGRKDSPVLDSAGSIPTSLRLFRQAGLSTPAGFRPQGFLAVVPNAHSPGRPAGCFLGPAEEYTEQETRLDARRSSHPKPTGGRRFNHLPIEPTRQRGPLSIHLAEGNHHRTVDQGRLGSARQRLEAALHTPGAASTERACRAVRQGLPRGTPFAQSIPAGSRRPDSTLQRENDALKDSSIGHGVPCGQD